MMSDVVVVDDEMMIMVMMTRTAHRPIELTETVTSDHLQQKHLRMGGTAEKLLTAMIG